MPVSIVKEGSILTTALEQALLTTPEQTPGIYVVKIEAPAAFVSSDTIVVRPKEKVRVTSSLLPIKTYVATLVGTGIAESHAIGPFEIAYEFDVTIQRTVGTDRTFTYRISRIG